MKLSIGLISDTHGLLRPEALAALAGSDFIVHAGDVGGPEILSALQRIAPVTAVRGNNDVAPWANTIARIAALEAGGISIYVLHDVNTLAIDPAAASHRVVVSGHSHRPRIDARNGVLFVNPGSAGPRRFSLPVCVAHLHIDGAEVSASIHALDVGASGASPPQGSRRRA